MNKITIAGNLTKVPELRQTAGGVAVTDFSVAVNEYRGGNQTSQFIQFSAFGKTAEFICQYFTKGSAIIVEDGRVQNNNYTDKNGNKVYSYQFIADKVAFAPKSSSSAQPAATATPMPQPVAPAMAAAPMPQPVAPAMTAAPMPQPVAPAMTAAPMPQPVAPMPQPEVPAFMNIPDGIEEQLPFN